MDWLVISNTKVRFKGVAPINGEGEYSHLPPPGFDAGRVW